MVVEDETLEDISIDELRESLCEHEPRFPISLWYRSYSVSRWLPQRKLGLFSLRAKSIDSTFTFQSSLSRFVAYSFCHTHGDGHKSYPLAFLFSSPPGCKVAMSCQWATFSFPWLVSVPHLPRLWLNTWVLSILPISQYTSWYPHTHLPPPVRPRWRWCMPAVRTRWYERPRWLGFWRSHHLFSSDISHHLFSCTALPSHHLLSSYLLLFLILAHIILIIFNMLFFGSPSF